MPCRYWHCVVLCTDMQWNLWHQLMPKTWSSECHSAASQQFWTAWHDIVAITPLLCAWSARSLLRHTLPHRQAMAVDTCVLAITSSLHCLLRSIIVFAPCVGCWTKSTCKRAFPAPHQYLVIELMSNIDARLLTIHKCYTMACSRLQTTWLFVFRTCCTALSVAIFALCAHHTLALCREWWMLWTQPALLGV